MVALVAPLLELDSPLERSGDAADSPLERSGDAAVVLDVLKRQDSLFAVLQPLHHHLVAADLVFPNLRRYALEVLVLVDVYPARVLIVGGLGDAVIALSYSVVNGTRGKSRLRKSLYLLL